MSEKESSGVFVFHFPGAPFPKMRPRFSTISGHAVAYMPPKERAATQEFQLYAKRQMSEFGIVDTIKRPILFSATFYFEPPKSWSKKKSGMMLHSGHTSKPDLSNLIKFAEDSLNGILWEDDSQIYAYGYTAKFWGEKSETIITVSTI